MASATTKGGATGRSSLNAVLFYVFLVIFVLVSVLPLIWVFKMSIVTKTELFATPPTILPRNPTGAEYVQVFSDPRFQHALINSAIISGVTTVVCLFFGSTAAYAIARLKFRFRTSVMTLILALSFFPQVAIIAPLFIQYSKVGIINTYCVVARGVLQGTAGRLGGSGQGGRSDHDPGVQEGDSAARGSGGVYHGDPDLHLRLERVPLRQHVPVRREHPAGYGGDSQLRHNLHRRLRCAGRRRGSGDSPARHTGPDLPAPHRLWPDGRGGQGVELEGNPSE